MSTNEKMRKALESIAAKAEALAKDWDHSESVLFEEIQTIAENALKNSYSASASELDSVHFPEASGLVPSAWFFEYTDGRTYFTKEKEEADIAKENPEHIVQMTEYFSQDTIALSKDVILALKVVQEATNRLRSCNEVICKAIAQAEHDEDCFEKYETRNSQDSED